MDTCRRCGERHWEVCDEIECLESTLRRVVKERDEARQAARDLIDACVENEGVWFAPDDDQEAFERRHPWLR